MRVAGGPTVGTVHQSGGPADRLHVSSLRHLLLSHSGLPPPTRIPVLAHQVRHRVHSRQVPRAANQIRDDGVQLTHPSC